MTRLTKTVRESVAEAMIKSRFEARLSELAERSAALFVHVHEAVYDEATRKLMLQLEKRHRTMFQHKTSIMTNCGGMRMGVGELWLGACGIYKRPEVQPRPFAYHYQESALTFVDCQLATDIRAFHSDLEGFKKDATEAHTKVLGALSSLTTIKQVEGNWPEALPFFARFMKTPGVTITTTNLPAVRFDELTTFFGLEKGEDHA